MSSLPKTAFEKMKKMYGCGKVEKDCHIMEVLYRDVREMILFVIVREMQTS